MKTDTTNGAQVGQHGQPHVNLDPLEKGERLPQKLKKQEYKTPGELMKELSVVSLTTYRD